MRGFFVLVVIASCGWSQDLAINANQGIGPLKPIWNYFGYDEPNYTYAANGKKLVGELAALGRGPAYIRTHSCWQRATGRLF